MHKYGAISHLAWLLNALLLSACASQIPQTIRIAPANSPTQAQVREQGAAYLGRSVRWGGTIIETGNRENATWFTVLGRPLGRSGEPAYTDDSTGRFIAVVPRFLDPRVYAPERRITVAGTLLRLESGLVGEYPYTYPVIEAQAWHLWPAPVARPYGYEDPFWHDPWWYDPWYYRPWYYNPWHPFGHHRRHHHWH